jgi:Uncharacterized protein conserved in bacteria
MLITRLLLLCAALCLAACGGESASTASNGEFPQRPIRVIVPFGPGGLADVTLRLAGESLGQTLGQPIIVENRPGAGGVAATNTMLNAAADGYTLIVLTNGTAIAESQFELNYDIREDLRPVSALAWFDLILLVNPSNGITTLEQLLEKGRQNPQGLRIATINPGSTQNLSAELFKAEAGIPATIISYRTSPDVLTALLRNEVDLAIDAYTALKGAIDGKQVVPLAVTGSRRNAALPDVPTAAESGLPNYVVEGWNAIYAQAGVPDDVVAKLNDAIVQVARLPQVQERFRELGVEARGSTPDEIQQRLLADIEKWRAVMVDAGLVQAR